jgi:DNA-binding MarR family transcriptional regulator
MRKQFVIRLDPTLDFMRILWTLEHGLQSASKRMETSLGVTGPQRLVLRIVNKHPGISAGDLAHIAKLHPSTITGIVQRLVKKSLVSVERDSGDNRRIRLFLRPEAQPFTRTMKGTVEQAVKQTLAQVPKQQLVQARAVLSALATALDV